MVRMFLCAFALLLSIVPGQANALQCVPYARETSGIQIFGNARTWWGQAAGRYSRGTTPQIGAVMAFRPTRGMPIGHVATVSQILSDREVLIHHANWSRINGRRGQIERNVRVIDVSDAGDWSKVRVWYAPLRDLGTSTYPLFGFIYKDGSAPAETQFATQSPAQSLAAPRKPLVLPASVDRIAALEG